MDRRPPPPGPQEMGRAILLAELVRELLAVDPPQAVREAVTQGTRKLASAHAVRLWERRDARPVVVAAAGAPPGEEEAALELRLVGAALSRSARSGGPGEGGAVMARGRGTVCHVVRMTAFGGEVGALAMHLYGDRLEPGVLPVVARYAESAGLAIHNADAREELRRMAFTDPLTGLANRRALMDAVAAAEPPVGLLFVDFDGLKAVNDLVGYGAGDAVIRGVGMVLGDLQDDGPVAGRLGGDEFLVVVSRATEAEAAAVADALTARLDLMPVPGAAGAHFRGASVGWAVAAPGEVPGDLLRRAAAAMRAEKARRRAARGEPAR